MILNDKHFEMYKKRISDDQVVFNRRSDCDLIAKGFIKHDSSKFYYLDSSPLNDYDIEVIESKKIDEIEGINVKVNIKGLKEIDLQNFDIEILSGKEINLEYNLEGVTISFVLPNRKLNIEVSLYPNNKNKLLSDDSFGYSYSSALIFPLLVYDRFGQKDNSYIFAINNFNSCNLYLSSFIKEYIKIDKQTLFWKDEILKKQNKRQY